MEDKKNYIESHLSHRSLVSMKTFKSDSWSFRQPMSERRALGSMVLNYFSRALAFHFPRRTSIKEAWDEERWFWWRISKRGSDWRFNRGKKQWTNPQVGLLLYYTIYREQREWPDRGWSIDLWKMVLFVFSLRFCQPKILVTIKAPLIARARQPFQS